MAMRRSPSCPEREQHPALETLERVMTSGVIVDRGRSEQHRETWFDLSVAGFDLLGVESDISTWPWRSGPFQSLRESLPDGKASARRLTRGEADRVPPRPDRSRK